MTVVSPEVVGLIDEVVAQWTGERRLFSAYVVSKEVQRLGNERGVATDRHLNLREAVHTAMLPALGDGSYDRSMQSIPTAPLPAFVFHPSGVDPTGYPAFDRDAPPIASAPTADEFEASKGKAASATATAAPAPASAPGAAQDTGTLGKDRLNVPSFVSKAAGFNAGDDVFVTDEYPNVAKPCLVLLKTRPDKVLTEYKVASDGRIRVPPAMLKIAGVEGSEFNFDGDDGKIVIVAKK
jgi:hypothetical protein